MTSTELALTSSVPLRESDVRMPVLGFGVYQIDRPDITKACLRAISAGYHHIDTAQLYHNEEEVGVALQQCGLPREEISSLPKSVIPVSSVEKIDPREDGFVDLFLIHSPHALKPKDGKEIWLALEKLHEEGKARAIGNQRETVDYCNEHGIVLQAFSPLARGIRLQESTVVEIAEKVGKSPAQVLIRNCLQKAWVPLPRSEKEEHIKQNADVFDFSISEDDMTSLDDLDRQEGPKFE
ncbi:aldo/keto reductase [Xylariaceae sp. FL0662B]|nr:aldo/keto reductase [Xylariaceae sp. FL0662B]